MVTRTHTQRPMILTDCGLHHIHSNTPTTTSYTHISHILHCPFVSMLHSKHTQKLNGPTLVFSRGFISRNDTKLSIILHRNTETCKNTHANAHSQCNTSHAQTKTQWSGAIIYTAHTHIDSLCAFIRLLPTILKCFRKFLKMIRNGEGTSGHQDIFVL